MFFFGSPDAPTRATARGAGYEALYGHILEANHDMLDLARRLGFVEEPRSGSEVTVIRRL